jgi:hypothetical protein
LYGADAYYKVSFVKGNLITSDRTINNTGGTVNTYTALPSAAAPSTSFVTHLGDGIVLMDRVMRQLFTNNDACWTDYGWDGSKWVVGAAGAKATHTSSDDLIAGIKVSFANAPTGSASSPQSGTSFTTANFLTQSVNWGLLKDNATRFNWASQWYSKPAQLNTVAEGTIPGVAPYTIGLPALTHPDFVRVETDSPELHTFMIGGKPVSSIYVAGEAPGPGEVSMKANGDGILTFNAADAGKNFQANPYAWVKN